jgi:squalene synthase HpnC
MDRSIPDRISSVGSMSSESRTAATPGPPLSQGVLESGRLNAQAALENFPVAMRWLPAAIREDLFAVYATARLIDEAGDSAPGDRRALLDEVERELDAAFRGDARHPVLHTLTRSIRRRGLAKPPFLRLIKANRLDQEKRDFESWDELLHYCSLSANPIGELVLQIFDSATPERIALSNDVCSALQIVEHCQDVGEDARMQRVYLPRVDRLEFGCRKEDLLLAPAPDALRRVIALQIERVRELLASGLPLVEELRGSARCAVSGYVAGGLAACDALERAGFDPTSERRRTRRRDVLRHFLGLHGLGAYGRRGRAKQAGMP